MYISKIKCEPTLQMMLVIFNIENICICIIYLDLSESQCKSNTDIQLGLQEQKKKVDPISSTDKLKITLVSLSLFKHLCASFFVLINFLLA